jgi:hypothetical protein
MLDVMRDVACEVIHASGLYPSFRSAHEGYAVVLEEVRELEAEVFKSPKRREYQKLYDEAKQVAAMAIRFMLDVDKRGCVR